MLGISIGLNSLSEHGACTAIFVAVACIVGFGLASIQTLSKISWIAWVGLAGILSASMFFSPRLADHASFCDIETNPQ